MSNEQVAPETRGVVESVLATVDLATEVASMEVVYDGPGSGRVVR
jgi:hypothetical protein